MPPQPSRRGRLPRSYALLHAAARALAWLASLGAILLLAYVGKEWPSKGQVIIAGIMGVSS